MADQRYTYTVRLIVVCHILDETTIATEDVLFAFGTKEAALTFVNNDVPELNRKFENFFGIPENPTIDRPVTVAECRLAKIVAGPAEAIESLREILVDGEARFNEATGLPPPPDLLEKFINKEKKS